MTMKNKQELIQQVVNLLTAMIEVEELTSSPPPVCQVQEKKYFKKFQIFLRDSS